MKTILETDKEYICDIHAPCFQMLTSRELELIRASKTQVLFRKGDSLTKQGTFASYILFVINGICKQYIEGYGSKSFNMRIVQPGEFVGLSAVFTKNIFNYSTVALTDCYAFLIEKDVIAKVIQKNGLFGLNIIKRYCEQNSNLFSTLQNVLYKQMNGRISETLIYLDSIRESHPDIFQLLSRKDIADFAAISTESAVKLLKSFEKDGLIELQDKDVIIRDKKALEDISKRG